MLNQESVAEENPLSGSSKTHRNYLFFIAKLGVTLGLMGLLARNVDWQALGNRMASSQPELVALAGLFMLAAVVIVGLRWAADFRVFDTKLSTLTAVRLTIIGLFLGQVLPGGIGGDAVRGWLAYRLGLGFGVIGGTLVLDRILALTAVLVLTIVSFLGLAAILSHPFMWGAAVTIGMLFVAMGGMLLLDKVPLSLVPIRAVREHRLVSKGQAMLATIRRSVWSWRAVLPLALAFTVHGLTILCAMILVLAFKLPIPLFACAVIMPLAILGTSLPISINGWGVREGALVGLLGLYGVSSSDALLLSLMLGLLNMIATLPGGLLWLGMSKNIPSNASESSACV